MLLMALLALPSAAALGLLGLSDPKRRRARAEPPAPAPRRAGRLALAALLACAAAAAAAGGAAALIVWTMAAAALGWAIAVGLALVPPDGLARADRAAATLLGAGAPARAAAGLRTAWRPRPSFPVAAGVAALVLSIVGGLAWHGSPPEASAAQRLLALALVDRIDRGEAERRAAAPCLAAVAAATSPSGLRDLLSGRDLSIDLPAGRGPDGAEAALQRCILAQGGTGAEVAPAERGRRYTLAGDVSRRIAETVTARLVAADTLAALADGLGPATGLLCRRLATAVGPDVDDIMAALRRDGTYARADELLRRLPALERLLEARRSDRPCPP